jgi:hypothetical protein
MNWNISAFSAICMCPRLIQAWNVWVSAPRKHCFGITKEESQKGRLTGETLADNRPTQSAKRHLQKLALSYFPSQLQNKKVSWAKHSATKEWHDALCEQLSPLSALRLLGSQRTCTQRCRPGHYQGGHLGLGVMPTHRTPSWSVKFCWTLRCFTKLCLWALLHLSQLYLWLAV